MLNPEQMDLSRPQVWAESGSKFFALEAPVAFSAV